MSPAKGRERSHHAAWNSSFCQVHTFKGLTPTSTYGQFIICMFWGVKILYQARFCLQISYFAILFTMLIGVLSFCCPSAGNKQSIHIVSLTARHTRSRPSAGHMTIYVITLGMNALHKDKLVGLNHLDLKLCSCSALWGSEIKRKRLFSNP